MQGFVWMLPTKEQIARMVAVHMAIAKFRRKNLGWARVAIEKYYGRRR